jgi:hypothetical protein
LVCLRTAAQYCAIDDAGTTNDSAPIFANCSPAELPYKDHEHDVYRAP